MHPSRTRCDEASADGQNLLTPSHGLRTAAVLRTISGPDQHPYPWVHDLWLTGGLARSDLFARPDDVAA